MARWQRPRQRGLIAVLAAVAAGASCFCGLLLDKPGQSRTALHGARQVIEDMYAAVNARDLEKAMTYVADDVVYEDFTFQEAFEGKDKVRELFAEAMELPKGLDFVIDSTAGGDSWSEDDGVGMTWHVEFDGVALPNGRGVSLYRTQGAKLVYARDIVESPLKLGGAALAIVGFIAPIIRASREPGQALSAAAAFAAAAAAYWYVLLLSPQGQFDFLVGPPAWAIDEKTMKNVVDESLNFFYIWPALNGLGLPSPTSLLGIAIPEVDPLRLAVFNLAEAYAFMFLPLMLWDRPQRKDVAKWWSPAMFLTNAVLLPYFSTRALEPGAPGSKPSWAPVFGLTALAVAVLAFWQAWGLFGGFGELIFSDRVAFAFIVDCTLFALLQGYVFSASEGPVWRFIPFLGLAAWLIVPDVQRPSDDSA
mmetsp:Transcript_68932/g.121864  ORF Transcript_68932/g.121864 Transcript_68932/m.121864 type:complete len:420 (+) Transcript_68932:30-1289(+)